MLLSNDDKTRVALGLAAASLQTPMLMYMDYRVRLPHHTFVVAAGHTRIPSVYGVCNIDRKGAFTYLGDKSIRVRSGKYDSSSALSHTCNLWEVFKWQLIPKNPAFLIINNGVSDEAPRFLKPLATAVSLFCEFDLDAVIHDVSAAGLSTFDLVERRMAPLSHDIAGLILPHDSFGSHLHADDKTIDEDLEKKNFWRLLRFSRKFGPIQLLIDIQLIVQQ